MDDLGSEMPHPIDEEELHTTTKHLGAGLLETVLAFISAYGWYIVFVFGVCIYLWKTRFEEQWRQWLRRAEENREASEYQRNPDMHIARQEAMIAARRRMQEQHDQMSAENAVKMKEKEEQKRLERLKELEQLEQRGGTRLRARPEEKVQNANPVRKKDSQKDSGRLRGEYNPLMGSGGGTTYRPDRRDCSSGG